MPLRVIEVIASEAAAITVMATAEQYDAIEIWEYVAAREPDTEAKHATPHVVNILTESAGQQRLLDALQACLTAYEDWRIVILPVEGIVPVLNKEKQQEAGEGKAGTGQANSTSNGKAKGRGPATGTSREELYTEVSKGVSVDANYILFVFLSTVVAAIGMVADNVAVVIGAMVIAPLLGPNLAFSLGVALGDHALMIKGLRASAVGVSLTLAASIMAGVVLPADFLSTEVLARTDVGFDSIALALASGAAAVLSLTTGLSSALVGVMVAVALLPPAAAAGMLFGAGYPSLAMGAGVLLAVNVVCVNLAAQIVLLFQGIGPRTWSEKQNAQRARRINFAVWISLLALLAVLIVVGRPYWEQPV